MAELAGNRTRARAVVRAWRWNFGRMAAIRARRSALQPKRRTSDKEIRLLQVRGSARLSAYFRRVFQFGFHGAHADELAAAAAVAAETYGTADEGLELEPDVEQTEAGRVTGRVRLATWLVAALLVVIGSRGVLTGRIPALGQFTPFPSWSSTFSQFFTGWHPSGVGTTAPATPALAISGVVGTVLLGAMGLTQKVLIFACLPLGAWGAVRLLRPFGSQRAALVAGLAYLAIPLPYNALALGRWGALVGYAGTPWVLATLARSTGLEPFVRRTRVRHGRRRHGARGVGCVGVAPRPARRRSGPRCAGGRADLVRARRGHRGGADRPVRGGFVVALRGRRPDVALAPIGSGVDRGGPGDQPAVGDRGAVERSGPGVRIRPPDADVRCGDLVDRGAVRRRTDRCVAAHLGVRGGRGGTAAAGPGGPVPVGRPVLGHRPGVLVRRPGSAAVAGPADWPSTPWSSSVRRRRRRRPRSGWEWRPSSATCPRPSSAGASWSPCWVWWPRRWRPSPPWCRRCPAAGTCRPTTSPSRCPGCSPRWRAGRSASCGSVTPAASTRAGGTPATGWPTPRRRTDRRMPGGCGTARPRGRPPSSGPTWTWPGTTAPTDSAACSPRAAVRYVVVLTSIAPEIAGEQSPTTIPSRPTCCRRSDVNSISQPVLSGTGITVFANAAWVPQRAEVPGRPGSALPAASPAARCRGRRWCRMRSRCWPGGPHRVRTGARWWPAPCSPRPHRRATGSW